MKFIKCQNVSLQLKDFPQFANIIELDDAVNDIIKTLCINDKKINVLEVLSYEYNNESKILILNIKIEL